jgi:LacI family transcriptional regulator
VRGKANRTPKHGKTEQKVSLKMLANRLGLSPATVSLVINRSSVADSIPQATKDRIFTAARELNYRPNFLALSLRTQRSFAIGVIVPEVSEGYATLVMSGIEDYLLQAGYLYFVASHRHKPDLIDEYPKLLLQRAVDGFIALDTPWAHADLPVPVVTVSGHHSLRGVTNILLNHARAAEMALAHLVKLGHRRVVFMRGQEFSSDTETRWGAIHDASRKLGLAVEPELCIHLERDLPTPELGYEVTRRLLTRRSDFTALFAFNDISAIGAVRALRSKGLRVPEDVSVVGFDDILSAAYQHPALTTVRQPLRQMGQIAAETVLSRITRPSAKSPREIVVEPELVIRESTAAARKT